MHRRWTFWIITLLLLLNSGQSSATAEWSRYVHPRLGFSLTYPAGWIVGPRTSGIEVMVLSPSPVSPGGVRLNVNVTSESLPPGVSLAQYEDANESQLKLLFHEYRRLRTDSTKVGEYGARLRYFTWRRNDGLELYQIQLVTIAGTHGYVVTGTTAASSANLQGEVQLLASILVGFRPR
jgi:hypothetical protein